MSEYQYYEFTAIEQPLSPKQQAELRRRSSRATITPGGFVNEYHWGDLKGDPLEWMQRYFDAHVYSANWGSCHLMLRLPVEALDRTVLDSCLLPSQTDACSGFTDVFTATANSQHLVLSWGFNDDSHEHERFWARDDGPDWMVRLLPLREELLHGDTRPLYLGWLARVCAGELDGDDPEPPLPAGLTSLTPAQQALTEFLMLDPDLLAAAAAASPAASVTSAPDLDTWLASQSTESMHKVLRMLAEGQAHAAVRTVRRDLLEWQRAQQPATTTPERRRVAQIAQGAEAARHTRLESERRTQEAEEAQRSAERAHYLAGLTVEPNRHWQAIDTTLQRGSGSAYDEALKRVQDLSEAFSTAGRGAEFQRDLTALMQKHGRRTAWKARLKSSGIL